MGKCGVLYDISFRAARQKSEIFGPAKVYEIGRDLVGKEEEYSESCPFSESLGNNLISIFTPERIFCYEYDTPYLV